MPQGARAETMARVAVMEHALARCKQVAYHADTGEEAARALRRAQAALKFAQMQELYALNEAVEFDDDPHPLGTHASLVTRPCAQIRGTLSYPTDPGVQAIGQDQAPAGDLNGSVALANAMRESAADTAALRNELRRQGLPSHFYVAPPADQIAFTPAPNPTGAGDADDPSATAPELQPAANAQTVPAATRVPEAAPAMPTDNVTEEPTAAVSAERASERLRPSDYSTDTWQRVINRAIVAASALRFEGEPDNGNSQDTTGAFLEMNKSTRDGAGEVTAQTRRDGLWNEMTRHVAISQDRLWVFVRLMSGCIGGDVQEVITMADAATLKASKAIEDQRTRDCQARERHAGQDRRDGRGVDAQEERDDHEHRQRQRRRDRCRGRAEKLQELAVGRERPALLRGQRGAQEPHRAQRQPRRGCRRCSTGLANVGRADAVHARAVARRPERRVGLARGALAPVQQLLCLDAGRRGRGHTRRRTRRSTPRWAPSAGGAGSRSGSSWRAGARCSRTGLRSCAASCSCRRARARA